MKFLLTSAGIKNDSIRHALVDLLGCKSQHYSGENTTIILVDKVSQGACPTWDNCCESHQFNPGIYILGKPIAESSALCIPTANYAQRGGAGNAWRFISGREPETPMCELGWKSLGVLELTALPSIDEALWVPVVRETHGMRNEFYLNSNPV
jgi:hypothetical protein